MRSQNRNGDIQLTAQLNVTAFAEVSSAWRSWCTAAFICSFNLKLSWLKKKWKSIVIPRNMSVLIFTHTYHITTLYVMWPAIWEKVLPPHTSFKTYCDTFPYSLFSIPNIDLCNFKINVDAPSEKTLIKGKGKHLQTEVGMSANQENQTCEADLLFRLST